MSYKKLQIRRGLKANIPTLAEGELGFCTDTKDIYVGDGSTNTLVGGDSLSATIDTKANITAITIPAGRMRGDVDGDGEITSADGYKIQRAMVGATKLDDVQIWCADANNDGSITAADSQEIYRCAAGLSSTLATTFADYYGKWTYQQIDSVTGKWYTDIAVTGMTASCSASVVIKGEFNSEFFTAAECIEGAIRIYATACPISDIWAIVSWGKEGDGTAAITCDNGGTTQSVTLTTTWTGSAAPYSQAVTLSGILATDTPILDLICSTSNYEAEQEAWGKVFKAVCSANTITFYASEATETAVTVQVKVVR